MKNTTRSKTLRCLLLAVLSASISASTAQAVLSFSITTFTTDSLTLEIPTSEVLSGSGSGALYFIDADGVNLSWYLGGSLSGVASGTMNISGSLDSPQTPNISENAVLGDIITVSFPHTLSDGDFVSDTLVISFSGSSLFDPNAIDNLALTWGTENAGSIYPFGAVQSTTAVPEPSIYALLSGLCALGVLSLRQKQGLTL